MYVADYANNKVRKISPAGVVSTFPGRAPLYPVYNPNGPKVWNHPSGIRVDNQGNIYIVELGVNSVSKIGIDGTITLLAGGDNTGAGYADGTGVAARFYWPAGVIQEATGNLLIVDSRNHMVRRVSPAGVTSRFAGFLQGFAEGTGTAAKFNQPMDITTDIDGNYLVTDYHNNKIRKVTPAGVVTTFAGSGSHGEADGTLTTAQIYNPVAIEADKKGNVYVSNDNQLLRWITPEGKVRTVHLPSRIAIFGMATDKNGELYIADHYNNRICKVTIQ